MIEINYEKAKRLADSDCDECGGRGWVEKSGLYPDNIIEQYCYCVMPEMQMSHPETVED